MPGLKLEKLFVRWKSGVTNFGLSGSTKVSKIQHSNYIVAMTTTWVPDPLLNKDEGMSSTKICWSQSIPINRGLPRLI